MYCLLKERRFVLYIALVSSEDQTCVVCIRSVSVCCNVFTNRVGHDLELEWLPAPPFKELFVFLGPVIAKVLLKPLLCFPSIFIILPCVHHDICMYLQYSPRYFEPIYNNWQQTAPLIIFIVFVRSIYIYPPIQFTACLSPVYYQLCDRHTRYRK